MIRVCKSCEQFETYKDSANGMRHRSTVIVRNPDRPMSTFVEDYVVRNIQGRYE